MSAAGNLLRFLPGVRIEEVIEPLVVAAGVRIERVVSHGQASPPGFWYDQDEAEFVLLVKGAARLRFADEAVCRQLGPGDWLDIAPHRRHRVEWTEPEAPTVWLAVFYT